MSNFLILDIRSTVKSITTLHCNLIFIKCILCSFQRTDRPQGRKMVELSRGLVGVTGVEPVTSSLSGTRSNQLSYTPGCVGGGNGIRTRDFQLAKLALYQLSYAPWVAPWWQTPLNSRVTPATLSNIHGSAIEAEAVRQLLSLHCRLAAPVKPEPIHPRGRMIVHIRRDERQASLSGILLRKEVIQPLVPQRLPCYDFIPVTNRTLGVHEERLRVPSASMM